MGNSGNACYLYCTPSIINVRFQMSPIKNWTSLTVFMAFCVSIISATLAVVLFFGFARFTLPILYAIPFLSMVLRPFTAHFLKGSWMIVLFFYHIHLAVHPFFLSTFLVWEITDSMFDRVIAEVRLFTSLYAILFIILS